MLLPPHVRAFPSLRCCFLLLVSFAAVSQHGLCRCRLCRHSVSTSRRRFPSARPVLLRLLQWGIAKIFFKKKITERVQLFGSDVAALHAHVPAARLPTDIGGTMAEPRGAVIDRLVALERRNGGSIGGFRVPFSVDAAAVAAAAPAAGAGAAVGGAGAGAAAVGGAGAAPVAPAPAAVAFTSGSL